MSENKVIINRLNRIEGQVRGISRMIDDDRYCIDILHQVHAVRAALGKVEEDILKNHAACCVADAISSGDAEQQYEKFSELVNLFAKTRN